MNKQPASSSLAKARLVSVVCKQAERERDLALEANRLFKQDFGDKIESLQAEVEQLRKHRWNLEHELRKERDRRSEPQISAPHRPASTPQRERKPPESRSAESRSTLVPEQIQSGELSSSLPSSRHEDEQGDTLAAAAQPSMCSMCEESDSLLRAKKRCKNCGEVFCESCVSRELPLPSSILPETVCTSCYSQLLQSYASTPT